MSPNRAGRTTTLRILLDLVKYEQDGHDRRAALPRPRRSGQAGRLGLEATNFHPGRKGRPPTSPRPATGIPESRVNELLELGLDLAGAARSVKTYSLGMCIAPWRSPARSGRSGGAHPRRAGQRPRPRGSAGCVSCTRARGAKTSRARLRPLLSEMAQLADRVVIIHRGRLISRIRPSRRSSRGRKAACACRYRRVAHAVLSPQQASRSAETSPGTLAVKDAPIERVGELAAHSQIVLRGLSRNSASLEEIFLELTGDATGDAT